MASTLYLSERDVAVRIGLPVETLARWRKSGLGPVYHDIGGRAMYLYDDLLEFLSRLARKQYASVMDHALANAGKPMDDHIADAGKMATPNA